MLPYDIDPQYKLSDLRKLGLLQTKTSYEFTHALLRDFYCARYIASCLLEETACQGQKEIFPTLYKWKDESCSTIAQFIKEKSNDPTHQRMWELVENLIVREKEAIDYFLKLKNQIVQDKVLIQETLNYEFKLEKVSADKLIITLMHSPDAIFKKCSQVNKLKERLLLYLKEMKMISHTEIEDDEHDFKITINSDVKTINQLILWMITFNSALFDKEKVQPSSMFHQKKKDEFQASTFECRLQ